MILLGLMLLQNISEAQVYEYGDSVKLQGRRLSYGHFENGDIMVLRSWDDRLAFDLFDSTLKLVQQWEYRLKSSMNKSERLLKYRWKNDRLVLFLQREDGGKRRQLLKVELTEEGSPEKILFVARGTKGFYPNLHLNQIKDGWNLWYESFSHPFKKHKRIHVLQFDQNFTVQWRDSFVIEEKDRLIKIQRFKIWQKGDYQMFYRQYETNTMAVKNRKPNSSYFQLLVKGGEQENFEILNKELFYSGIHSELVGRTLIISGLYSKKVRRIDGLFRVHIETDSMKNSQIEYCALPKKLGRKMDPWGMRNKLKFLIMDKRIEQDSFTLWFAEEFTYKLKGTPTVPQYELTYGTILIAKTDNDFNLVDWETIGKKHVVSDRKSQFGGYQIMEDRNGISLMMAPSKRIWPRKKEYDYAEPKEHLGFYWYFHPTEEVSLKFQERYYPTDRGQLPQTGSLKKIGKDRYLVMLISKNFKYYQPALMVVN